MERGEGVGQRDNLLEMGGGKNVQTEKQELTMVRMERKNTEGKMLNGDTSPESPEEEPHEDEGESDSSSSDDEKHSHMEDPNTCKGKLAIFLKTNLVQYTIIALVIGDCLIIVLELLIDMDIIVFPENDPPTSDSHAASHPIASASHSVNYSTTSLLGGTNGSHHNSSNYGNFTHDHHTPHHHTNKEKAAHILHILSLAILSIFMVEVCFKVFVEGKHLLKQKAEVFDSIVVVVSFTLDITFSFVNVTSAASDAAGLMVLLRLWRVTRIINGVIMSVKLDAKKKSAVLKRAVHRLEKENKKLRSKVEKLERENVSLKKKLHSNNRRAETASSTYLQANMNSIPDEDMRDVELNDSGDKT